MAIDRKVRKIRFMLYANLSCHSIDSILQAIKDNLPLIIRYQKYL